MIKKYLCDSIIKQLINRFNNYKKLNPVESCDMMYNLTQRADQIQCIFDLDYFKLTAHNHYNFTLTIHAVNWFWEFRLLEPPAWNEDLLEFIICDIRQIVPNEYKETLKRIFDLKYTHNHLVMFNDYLHQQYKDS